MAALQEIQFTGTNGLPQIDSRVEAAIKENIRAALWQWIDDNGNREFTLKIWIIRKTFKLSDLHHVFAIILGERYFTK